MRTSTSDVNQRRVPEIPVLMRTRRQLRLDRFDDLRTAAPKE